MTTLKAQRAAEVLLNRKQAFAKRVRTLTGHVADRFPAARFEQAMNAGKTADQFAAEIAAREPIGAALHTQKAEAVKSAAMDAAVTIGKVQLELEQAGWDINVVAPYPSSFNMGRSEYQTKKAKYALFSSLTEDTREGYHHYRKGEPKIVRMSEKGIDRFIRFAEEAAAIQYDMFICKMVKKVGPTATDAAINGDHIWAYSILIVEHEDGSVERWKTQQIWNYSVHGTRFPQWPSRKVK